MRSKGGEANEVRYAETKLEKIIVGAHKRSDETFN